MIHTRYLYPFDLWSALLKDLLGRIIQKFNILKHWVVKISIFKVSCCSPLYGFYSFILHDSMYIYCMNLVDMYKSDKYISLTGHISKFQKPSHHYANCHSHSGQRQHSGKKRDIIGNPRIVVTSDEDDLLYAAMLIAIGTSGGPIRVCRTELVPILWHLTHWGQNKMAVILQTTFQTHFQNKNCCILIEISLKFVTNDLIDKKAHWYRQWLGTEQAIIWPNDD